ncbi:PrsW family glutamic-type intramembrane protease [Candidatus Margulisiibacteriota bacterium]
MIALIIIFIVIYPLIQLFVVSPTRTVNIRTIVSFFFIGLFCSTAAAFILNVISTHLINPDLVSFTINPIVEETLKVLPVFVVLYYFKAGRNLGILDAMLLAAACGTGYALFEDMANFNVNYSVVSRILYSRLDGITSQWLPDGYAHISSMFLSYGSAQSHGVWAAFIGIALGFSRKMFSYRRNNLMIVYGVPFIAWLWTVWDHASYNYGRGIADNHLTKLLYDLTQRGRLLPYALAALIFIALIIEIIMINKMISRETKVFLPEENSHFSFLGEIRALFRQIWARDFDKLRRIFGIFTLRRQLAWAKLEAQGRPVAYTDELRKKIQEEIKRI